MKLQTIMKLSTAHNSYAHRHYSWCLPTGTGAMPMPRPMPMPMPMFVNNFYFGNTSNSKYSPARLRLSSLSSSPVVNDFCGGTANYSYPGAMLVNDFYFEGTASYNYSPARLRLSFSRLTSSPVALGCECTNDSGSTSSFSSSNGYLHLPALSSLCLSGFAIGTRGFESTPWDSPAKRRLSAKAAKRRLSAGFSLSSSSSSSYRRAQSSCRRPRLDFLLKINHGGGSPLCTP